MFGCIAHTCKSSPHYEWACESLNDRCSHFLHFIHDSHDVTLAYGKIVIKHFNFGTEISGLAHWKKVKSGPFSDLHSDTFGRPPSIICLKLQRWISLNSYYGQCPNAFGILFVGASLTEERTIVDGYQAFTNMDMATYFCPIYSKVFNCIFSKTKL